MKDPRTLDELLVLLPGLRKLRQLDAAMLRVLLDRRRKECTWCGRPSPPSRSTWCSDQCVDAFKLRCDPNRQRIFVETASHGLCQQCGRDTLASEQQAKAAGLTNRWQPDPNRDAALLALGFARGRWREVDHVLPVCEGGGLCDISWLALVCGACHLERTSQLAKRRKGAA